MRLPTINQYVDSVNDSFRLFKSIGDIDVERDTYNNVRVRSGNSASIFKIVVAGNQMLLKCYIKPGQNLHRKYKYIGEKSAQCDFIVEAKLMPEELFVYNYLGGGKYFDVVIAPWVEGFPLNLEIKWAAEAGDDKRLGVLCEKFDRLALSLLTQEWAHGDIKPENIIVSPDTELFLIDYDAIFIPALASQQTSEIGTAVFQHPMRDVSMYDKHIDDYSIAMISVSLHALADDPSLYSKYNSGDNIILNPAQIICGSSELFEIIKSMWSKRGLHALIQLTSTLSYPTPYIDGLAAMLEQVVQRDPCRDSCATVLLPTESNGLWGYIDHNSQWAIEPIYDMAHGFSCELAAVLLCGTWHFIDSRQNVVINCTNYCEVKPFCNDLAAVRHGDLWGYIRTDGSEAIAPSFHMAASFHEGLAVVRVCDKYGYINHQGQWYIEPVFDYATSFKSSRAEVEQNGDIFYIEK